MTDPNNPIASASDPTPSSTPSSTLIRVVLAETSLPDGPLVLCGHHYAKAFRRAGAEVLWLCPPVSLAHAVAARTRSSARERRRLWRDGGRETEVGLAYAPFTFLPCAPAPGLQSRAVAELSLRFTAPNLGRWCERRDFARPDAFLIHNLHLAPLADRLAPRRVVLRMEDDLSAMPAVPRGLLEIEADWARRADAIVCASSALAERARALRGRDDAVFLTGNGCDFDRFASGANDPAPPWVEALPRPRVLYFGSGGPWFDRDLVAAAARRMTDVQWILIGRDLDPAGLWTGLPNVHARGPMPQADLPAIAARCDAGLIPFRLGPIHDAADPIKMYEYMAAGLSVAATHSKSLAESSGPVILSDGAVDGFERAVREAIARKDRRAEKDFARAHSWEDIARRVVGIALGREG